MFRFADPSYFLLLIPAGVAAWFIYQRRIRAGILFAPTSRIPAPTATWRTLAARTLPALLLLGVALGIIALARPQTVLARVHRKVDVIAIEMVVDVSESMRALDMSEGKPSLTRYRTRLDAVKKVFAEFIEQRPDDLIGLVTFGGYATTRAPLTTDRQALLHILKGVDIPQRTQDAEELNTAIGDALATACARLKDAHVKSRIIVLLSDGTSNTGIIRPEEAIHAAEELGIKVYTIGVGSNGDVPFLGRDLFGRPAIGYTRVPMDEQLLGKMADVTGGHYFNVRDPAGLEKAMTEINKLETTGIEREEYEQYNERFLWFLAPALGLLVAGTSLHMLLVRRIV